MQVTKIASRNILGVEALEFTPSAVTRITGGNGPLSVDLEGERAAA